MISGGTAQRTCSLKRSGAVKRTAAEKEAQIMADIQASSVKFTPTYHTTILGNFFEIGFKSN